jgi:predicted enzyme related to lactoylglutathione lyase
MGERTQHAPGTFSWADVTTTDQEDAKRFYSGLFGWEADDSPVGDGILYSMMKLDGRAVAAISPQPQQQRETGVPPMWNNYVTVESADSAAARAGELGATVHAPPFDVMDVGRMAVIQDPQGAFFMVWEPRASIGAELVNAPGALSWNELASPDPPESADFYGSLFGWAVEEMENAPMPYLIVRNGERTNGGIREMGEEPAPPHWMPYFGIDDAEGGLARAGELGGSVLAGPLPAGPGRMGVIRDPQGAVFGIFEGEFDD